ncbi:hypothetical protein D9M72_443480 [compost metagenome]
MSGALRGRQQGIRGPGLDSKPGPYEKRYRTEEGSSERSAGDRDRNSSSRDGRSRGGHLQLRRDGGQMAAGVGRPQGVHPRRRRLARAPLRPRHVPLPLRRPAHGSRRGVCHGRRRGALPAPEGLRRPAPDRLGLLRLARRERRHQAQRAPQRVDLRQHRHPGGVLQALCDLGGLVTAPAHLGPGVLPVDPVAVQALLRTRPGVPEGFSGQLVPQGPDRTGQRTGGQRGL